MLSNGKRRKKSIFLLAVSPFRVAMEIISESSIDPKKIVPKISPLTESCFGAAISMHNRKQIFIIALLCVFMRLDSTLEPRQAFRFFYYHISLSRSSVGRQYSSTSTLATFRVAFRIQQEEVDTLLLFDFFVCGSACGETKGETIKSQGVRWDAYRNRVQTKTGKD